MVFANQLSFLLLIFILGLFLIENISRNRAQYHSPSKGIKEKQRINLYGFKAFFAFFVCFCIFNKFCVPSYSNAVLDNYISKNFFDLNIFQLFLNTIYLVFLTSLVLLIFSFISNYGNRVSRSKFLNFLSTFSISGYAIPGIILAVAFITFMAWFDNNVIKFFELNSIKKIFIGSVTGLVIVYFIRFYSLAFNGVKAGYQKINRSIDESSYLLGYSKLKTFTGIHIPF